MLADRRRRVPRRSIALAAGAVLAVMALAAGARAAVSTGPALRQVSYGGYTFRVPRTWPVIDLAAHPGECVEFDRHVVYLGVPADDQACPSRLAGTTEALLIQPSAAGAVARSVENPVERLISVVTRRITVTATYGADQGQIDSILARASLPAPAAPMAAAVPLSLGSRGDAMRQPVVMPVPASATNDTGPGFDTCAAPSSSVMRTLLHDSPYRAVGIYIGGSDRACAQVNLSAAWVAAEAAAGWHFLPLYVGPQASFGELSSPASQAVNAAQDAVAQARLLGFGSRTPIYYDMEAYSPGQNSAALIFFSSWTRELHELGYRSGIYSSSLSGVIDLVNNYTNPADTMPDVIYDALWNGSADTQDPVIPATSWPGHLRVHQYSGNIVQTFGGVSLDLDQDYLDVQMTAAGGSTQASQAAADQSNAVVNTFFRGSDGALWHDWFAPGTGWHGPSRFGGSLASQPSVVATVPGAVAVFYQGTDGGLWSASYTPGRGWSPLRNLGMGVLGGRPMAVAQADGVIDVFWPGSVGSHLWHARYRPGSGWNGPQDLGGSLASGPSPAVSSGHTVSVFWRGSDGRLWHTLKSPGQPWRPPARLGARPLGGPPVATGQGNGTIDVFWREPASASLWHTTYVAGQGWGSATVLATGAASAPFAVASAAGSVDVFWTGAGGRLWWTARQEGAWLQPASLPMGSLGGAPFAAGQGDGMIDVFWRGSADLNLWHARYTGSWSGPDNLGGSAS
jgi:Rv2525c-like, glycoside hydrolase-like domain